MKTSHGADGHLAYIYGVNRENISRANDRGQDSCSYFFRDQSRIVFTSTRDHLDMDVSSLDVGPENAVPFDSTWGTRMMADEG